LKAHVMSGYNFLMQNYACSVRLGFSRGAYTARALAGVLDKVLVSILRWVLISPWVGLLPRDNEEQVPFAYRLYTREDENGVRLSAGFNLGRSVGRFRSNSWASGTVTVSSY
ncbi:hypothetical protein BDZ89DRAFT_950533, partial [Hymenopellis radicata]